MMPPAPEHVPMTSSPLPITIRRATPADLPTLKRLASLDSQRLTPGPHLVAERSGSLIAAVDVHDARWFADPFQPTADAVALLQERATHITRERRATTARSLGMLRGLFPAAPRRA
jgi:hypothetical protein